MSDRIEGAGGSQLFQVIKQFGYNKDIDIELGTVLSPPPSLTVKVDGMKIELDASDLVVAETLTNHSRNVKITSSGTTTVYSDEVSGRTPNTDSGPWSDVNIKDLTISNGDLTVTDATVEYLDELKAGDRVIVASINNGQTYVILDRAVTY